MKDAFFDVARVKAVVCDRYRRDLDGAADPAQRRMIVVRVLIGKTWITVAHCGDRKSPMAIARAERAVWLIAKARNIPPRSGPLWSVDGLVEMDAHEEKVRARA